MSENDDVLKDLRLSFYERFSNPVVFSFCISWSVLHFEILLAIFSSSTYIEKINFIKGYFSFDYYNVYYSLQSVLDGCEGWYANPLLILGELVFYNSFSEEIISFLFAVLYSVAIPFLISVSYIYFMPKLTHGIVAYHIQMKQALVHLKKEAEGLELLTEAESVAVKNEWVIKDKELEEVKNQLALKDNQLNTALRQSQEASTERDKQRAVSLHDPDNLKVVKYSFYKQLLDSVPKGFYSYEEFFGLSSTPISPSMIPACIEIFKSMAELFEGDVDFLSSPSGPDLAVRSSEGVGSLEVEILSRLEKKPLKEDLVGEEAVALGVTRETLQAYLDQFLNQNYVRKNQVINGNGPNYTDYNLVDLGRRVLEESRNG